MLIIGILIGFFGAIALCAYALEQIEAEAYKRGFEDGLKAGGNG